MKKILRTTIVCLLIPSFVFAQIPQYRANETTVKQTDLARVWNALNTEVGQQIVSYIETTIGNIDLEHAKAFTTANGEVAYVPIKAFSRVLAALCYRQMEDGSEYLFLITYNATQKSVAFTFPSGQMYVMKSSGVTESINPDFQFQEYNDLSNRVGTNANEIINLLCSPVSNSLSFIVSRIFQQCFCVPIWGGCNTPLYCGPLAFLFFISTLSFPLWFIVPAYSSHNSNLEMISILFAVYYYGCLLNMILTNIPEGSH
jgi:hypothetical protein